ncbi:MAG: hypothetical protein JXR83_02120 [Deltaproteobacteria bacterium]|nr:hypothetical protein [Deltaproteobacteria bacterium]
MRSHIPSPWSRRSWTLAAALAFIALGAGCRTPASAVTAASAAAGQCRYTHLVDATAVPAQPIQQDEVAAFCGAAFEAAACGPCRWSMAVASRCGGAESSPAQDLICTCNQCLQDGDCTARPDGRCIAARDRSTTVQMCVYAGGACHPAAGCAAGQECAIDGAGALVCQPAEPCGGAG